MLRKMEYKQNDFLGGYKALKTYLTVYDDETQDSINEKKAF